MSNINPRNVIYYMRLISNKNGLCYWPEDVGQYIMSNELMSETWWPSYCVRITDKGINYIHEHGEEEDE